MSCHLLLREVIMVHAGGWAEELAKSGDPRDKKALALAISLSRRVSHPVSDALATLGDGLEELQRSQPGSIDAALPRIDISDFKRGDGEPFLCILVHGDCDKF